MELEYVLLVLKILIPDSCAFCRGEGFYCRIFVLFFPVVPKSILRW